MIKKLLQINFIIILVFFAGIYKVNAEAVTVPKTPIKVILKDVDGNTYTRESATIIEATRVEDHLEKAYSLENNEIVVEDYGTWHFYDHISVNGKDYMIAQEVNIDGNTKTITLQLIKDYNLLVDVVDTNNQTVSGAKMNTECASIIAQALDVPYHSSNETWVSDGNAYQTSRNANFFLYCTTTMVEVPENYELIGAKEQTTDLYNAGLTYGNLRQTFTLKKIDSPIKDSEKGETIENVPDTLSNQNVIAIGIGFGLIIIGGLMIGSKRKA